VWFPLGEQQRARGATARERGGTHRATNNALTTTNAKATGNNNNNNGNNNKHSNNNRSNILSHGFVFLHIPAVPDRLSHTYSKYPMIIEFMVRLSNIPLSCRHSTFSSRFAQIFDSHRYSNNPARADAGGRPASYSAPPGSHFSNFPETRHFPNIGI